MHMCTNCAHNTALGSDAASVCTNCGLLAVDAAALITVSVYAAALVGVAYLFTRATRVLIGVHNARTA